MSDFLPTKNQTRAPFVVGKWSFTISKRSYTAFFGNVNRFYQLETVKKHGKTRTLIYVGEIETNSGCDGKCLNN